MAEEKLPQDTNAVKPGRKYRGSRSYVIPIWNGIFEHASRIGPAIWEFLWCIDKITKEVNGVGIVLGGAPVKLQRIADDLQSNKECTRRNMRRLEAAKYIRTIRTPYGQKIEVLNSKKFGVFRKTETTNSSFSAPGETTNSSHKKPLKVVSKEDSANNSAENQPLPEWVPVPLWAAFLEMRNKVIRSKTTTAEQELLLEQLQKLRHGNDPSEVLKQSIRSRWKDLYAIRKNSKPPGSDTAQDHIDRINRNAAILGVLPKGKVQ